MAFSRHILIILYIKTHQNAQYFQNSQGAAGIYAPEPVSISVQLLFRLYIFPMLDIVIQRCGLIS